MIISSKDEDLIIKWLFGEVIYQKNGGIPVKNNYQWRWATATRFQKILFNIAEEQGLPLTRSWYMWGGYVHTPLLEQDGFLRYRRIYSYNPDRVEKLRSKVMELGLDVENILEEVIAQTSYFTSKDSRTLLPLYYEEKTPEDFKTLYLTKQRLNDLFDIFSSTSKYDLEKHYYQLEDDYHKQYYLYDIESMKLLDTDDINFIKNRYYSLVNTILNKIEIYVMKGTIINREILRYFKDVFEFYKNHVWKPYAAIVSQKTVTGFRAKEEKIIMAEKEFVSIDFGKKGIDELSYNLNIKGIEPSYNEYVLISSMNKLDSNTKNTVDELFSIYQRKPDYNE